MKYQRAFSLFEVAVVLVITSLVAGIAMKAYNSTGRIQCYAETQKKIDRVKEAVNRYMMSNDRFPLPAKRYLGITDPEYGKEAAPADLDTADNNDDRVIYGALPFSTLNLSREDAVDCWGNKFTYVVSYVLTDKTKFLQPTLYPGKIKIFTEYAHIALDKPFLKDGGFAIISHGADGLGAVKENQSWPGTGGQNPRKWCFKDETKPIGHNNNKLDGSDWSRYKNCLPRDVHLVSRPINDGKDAGGNFFDDIIAFRGPPYKISAPPLPPDSNLYCWGDNSKGQIGDGTGGAGLIQKVPKAVKAATIFLNASTASNGSHTCGVDIYGFGYCWGENGSGQLGDNTRTDRQIPTRIDTGGIGSDAKKRFIYIATVRNNSCGLNDLGEVYCWGEEYTNRPTLASAGPYVNLVAGMQAFCGLRADGDAYCWGWNSAGQLGTGIAPYDPSTFVPWNPTPNKVLVPGGRKLSTISLSGKRGCGLTADDGTLYCWGSEANRYSSTAAGCVTGPTYNYCIVPVQTDIVDSGRKFSRIAAAIPQPGGPIATFRTGTAGLTKDGDVYFWYLDNAWNPQIGWSLANSVADIQTSGGHTCLTYKTGGNRCWGYNGSGQLGNDSIVNSTSLVDVSASVPTAVQLDRINSNGNNCGVKSVPDETGWYHPTMVGGLFCWGKMFTSATPTPTYKFTQDNFPPRMGLTIATLGVGSDHACISHQNKKVYCWSDTGTAEGQGISSGLANTYTPTGSSGLTPNGSYVMGLPDVKVVDAASGHTCALTVGNELYCWGKNNKGQIGDGGNTRNESPTKVNIPEVKNIFSIGPNHGCAITVFGDAYCWGDNSKGQLGNGSFGTSNQLPQRVIMPAGVGAFRIIDANGYNTCALANNGLIYCWGDNTYGQLGYGVAGGMATAPLPVRFQRFTFAPMPPTEAQIRTDYNTPTPEFREIAVGGEFACARDKYFKVFCWGRNNMGQVGTASGAATIDWATGARDGGSRNLDLFAMFPSWDLSQTPVRNPYEYRFAMGYDHVCTEHYGGGVGGNAKACWGSNDNNKLGINSGAYYNYVVAGPNNTSSMFASAGSNGVCASGGGIFPGFTQCLDECNNVRNNGEKWDIIQDEGNNPNVQSKRKCVGGTVQFDGWGVSFPPITTIGPGCPYRI